MSIIKNSTTGCRCASFAAQEMGQELTRLSDIGGAIAVLGKVAEVIQVYSGCDPDHENDSDLMNELNNGYVTGGIVTAMTELGHLVADLAESLRERLDDGEVYR